MLYPGLQAQEAFFGTLVNAAELAGNKFMMIIDEWDAPIREAKDQPEIQREYVWGNNSDVLEKFLQELEKKGSPCQECHHVHTNKNINVGFLYSYKPS